MGLRGPQKPKISFSERSRVNFRPNIMICESCISWFTAGYSAGITIKCLFSASVDSGGAFCTFERINNSFCDHSQPKWKFVIFHFFKNPEKYWICDDLHTGQQNRKYGLRMVPVSQQCRRMAFLTSWTRVQARITILGHPCALSRTLLEMSTESTFSATKLWRCVAKRNICC